ncbi:Uncharacterized protein HZ326_2400 [Fusarium oxysporum f. sp. albedinis]|nr:Uncharacterized protein HZ326_2400 [Fusarium oxysporum f. sp. albedinis]
MKFSSRIIFRHRSHIPLHPYSIPTTFRDPGLANSLSIRWLPYGMMVLSVSAELKEMLHSFLSALQVMQKRD